MDNNKQTTDLTAQLNLKIDATLREEFATQCRRLGRSQRDIVQQLVTAWLAGAQDSSVRHLNGDKCPVALLFEELAQQVRDHILATQRQPPVPVTSSVSGHFALNSNAPPPATPRQA